MFSLYYPDHTITLAAVTTLFQCSEILHGPFIEALNSNTRHRLNRMTADIVIEQAVGRDYGREKRRQLCSPIRQAYEEEQRSYVMSIISVERSTSQPVDHRGLCRKA
jgi:hypothetical protein